MKYLNLFGDKYYKIRANQLPSGLQSSPDLSMLDEMGLFEFDESELSEINNNCEKFRYKMNVISPKWMGIKNGVIQITPIDQKVDVEDNNISLIQIWKGYDEWYYTEFRKKDSADLRVSPYYYKCDQLDGLIECLIQNIGR